MAAQVHPVPNGEDVTFGFQINPTEVTGVATVIGHKKVGQSYHYHLQTTFVAPNTASATVQLTDFDQSLIILKEE